MTSLGDCDPRAQGAGAGSRQPKASPTTWSRYRGHLFAVRARGCGMQPSTRVPWAGVEQIVRVVPSAVELGLGRLVEWEIRDQPEPLCFGLQLKRQHARVNDQTVDLDEPHERMVGEQFGAAELRVHRRVQLDQVAGSTVIIGSASDGSPRPPAAGRLNSRGHGFRSAAWPASRGPI
jgi:hypothetical protein